MDYRLEIHDLTSNGLELGGHCLNPTAKFGTPIIVMLKVPESCFEQVLNHEVIHAVLWKLFGEDVSRAFDNIAFDYRFIGLW